MDCDNWPVPEPGECASGCSISADVDPEVLETASAHAGTILHTLSGQMVGTCTEILRPIGECCNLCGAVCRCSGSGDRVRLQSSNGPVTGVTEVKVDGIILDPSLWRYYPSGQVLYRVPDAMWPRVDRKWAGCDDPETMCVTVQVGTQPDSWALSVHAELTCELVKSCSGGQCRIPKNATAVNAQGISITLTPTEAKQFIPSVAGWVAAVNPNSVQSVPMVFSPDTKMAGNSGCGCG